MAQLFSAWLVVIITTDRWIRTRFPFKANTLCTPKTALIAAGILLIIVVGLNFHVLLPFFGGLLPGIPHLACGANGVDPAYASFYFLQWTIIQVSEHNDLFVEIDNCSLSLDRHHFFWTDCFDDYYDY